MAGRRQFLPHLYANSGTKPSSDHNLIILARPSEYYDNIGQNIAVQEEGTFLVGQGEPSAVPSTSNLVRSPSPSSSEAVSDVNSQQDPQKVQDIARKVKSERDLAAAGPLVVAAAEARAPKLSGEGKRSSSSSTSSQKKKLKVCHTFKFN
jgi:hypothetical protein